MKISNTMHIKNANGTFDDVKISYIAPEYCTIEGTLNKVGNAYYAHAEGYNNSATGDQSHAEGKDGFATGNSSHVEGTGCRATTFMAHAEGMETKASGLASHSEGGRTIAASEYQHAQGQYNIEDANNTYAHIVGNGTSETNRSNAHTLDWDGNAWFAGDIKDGKGNILDNAQKQADKAYTLAEKKVSGISNSIVTGSHIYDGPSTSKFSFVDENIRGKSFIICGTQDAGNPVLRAYISENTITVDVSDEVTNMRVNYICF